MIHLSISLFSVCFSQGKSTLKGRITDAHTSEPIIGATITIDNQRLWAISDENGYYHISGIDSSAITLKCTSLGYLAQTINLSPKKGINICHIALHENNLALNEVLVIAQKKTENQTTSYLIDRHTIEHAQILNLNYITSLLPGGKTIGDQNLASTPQRIALHAGAASELGNASFGTAIDIDGQRLENNAVLNETKGTDLRHIGASNIESVEVVTGIPSVEYGDLSNGIIKLNTRKGQSPWKMELMLEPKTKSIAISKGLALGKSGSTLNFNMEHTRSITNLASPYTAYNRNNLNITYTNTFTDKNDHPLKLTASLSGNIGGYNSEADPDEFKNTYSKTNDHQVRGNIELDWLLDRSWISNLSVQATASYSDKKQETKSNKNSASTQPYIHTTEQGYFIGELYEDNPNANIILGPTGYWYVRSYTESKPITWSIKAKADWNKRWEKSYNRLLVGGGWNANGNIGRGTYYNDMRTAPTWRAFRYDELPFMNNASFFAENKYALSIGQQSSFQFTTGIRWDMTHIKKSEYGTSGNWSPRIKAKFVFWEKKEQAVSDLAIHSGWGKSVKQPSFAVLYPSPTYSDMLAFAPGTTTDGKTFYAYYTQPTTPIHNPDLKWQYTIQQELGMETRIYGTRISISAFRNKTLNPYMSRTIYTPYTYKLTTQAHLENGCNIPVGNRQYIINQQTGIVTVKDRTGVIGDQTLGYSERNTFASQAQYTNGSPIERRGIDFILDFPTIHPLRTSIRLDGNYYRYKGLNETLVTSTGRGSTSMDGTPYKYLGHYAGSSSVSNGSLSKEINANLTVVTHIPQIRMILSLRIESSLYNYKQNLSEYMNGQLRGMAIASPDDYTGTQTNGIYNQHAYVAVYPEYYSTWENPNELIPFAEKFLWAKENDPILFQELAKLVVKSNYAYYFNANRISAHYAANINLTKEIGNRASITFYARNFFYQMGKVRSSQTALESSLFDSGYIPKFYYGLSVRLKF